MSPSEAKVDLPLTAILIKIVLPSSTKLKLVSLQPLEKSEVLEASTAVMYILYVEGTEDLNENDNVGSCATPE